MNFHNRFALLILLTICNLIRTQFLKSIQVFASYGENDLKRLEMFESHLVDRQIFVRNTTPSFGYWLENRPSSDALVQNKLALVNHKNTLQLIVNKCNYRNKKCLKMNSTTAIDTAAGTSIPDEYCETYLQQAGIKAACSSDEKLSKYRSFSGHCNNKKLPYSGQASTAYKRLYPGNYADSIWQPRRTSTKSARSLPAPRSISAAFQKVRSGSSTGPATFTLSFLYWGQFLFHDLIHTAVNHMIWQKKPIECCDPNGWPLSPRNLHKFCFAVPIDDSNDDNYNSKNVHCLNYVRSLIALPMNCKYGQIGDQTNLATHYLDGSQIYGTTKDQSNAIRTFRNGQLKMTADRYLEKSNPFCYGSPDNCYRSGDHRVNMNLNSAVFHTLFFREHNRIAKKLSDLNPTWSDDVVFEKSRKIVIAEIQHITYNEWLTLFDYNYHDPNSNNISMSFYSKYSDKIDFGIFNEFSIFFNTLLNSMFVSELKLVNDNQNVFDVLRLRDFAFKNLTVLESDDNFDGFVRGMTIQHADKVDLQFTNDVVNDLYANDQFGLDAFSLDIQRSRDHGLPNYTSVFEHEYNQKVNTFDDLQDRIDEKTLVELRKLYDDVNDIDLIVGGLAESSESQLIVGKLFNRILQIQFSQLRDADSFFYTNDKQNYFFSRTQLKEIQKVSLASILCRNSNNITKITSDPFQYSKKKKTIACSKYPVVDLTKF